MIESQKYKDRRMFAIALAMGVLGVGVSIERNSSVPPQRTVTEQVRPYDTVYSFVERAEEEHGAHPNAVDITPEVDRLVEKYGMNLEVGQEIPVHVDG